MSAIHGKDTRPERIVRQYLWRHGFRYRLYNPRLPGHPDIVLKKYRTCIFVNGCFWHGHEGCKYFTLPKTHQDYWLQKINRNRERDCREQQQLARMGWHSITVWECQLKKKLQSRTLESLVFTLNHIFLEDHSVPYAAMEEDGTSQMAAEQMPKR
ncbi:MAG TPA: very short patch repair endonuclease [Prevotella sp.]|nr:very short patch repair endonuclease [Prevotella sp.]